MSVGAAARRCNLHGRTSTLVQFARRALVMPAEASHDAAHKLYVHGGSAIEAAIWRMTGLAA